MPESPSRQQGNPEATPPEQGYAPTEFQIIFSDGVTGILPGIDVVKITMSRTEPNFNATLPNKVTPNAQVILPITGFIQATYFFLNTIDRLVQNGTLTRERVDMLKGMAGGAGGAS